MPLDVGPVRWTLTMFSEISAQWSLLEPSFRYLSRSSKQKKCRLLDHMKPIPCMHSVQLLIWGNSCKDMCNFINYFFCVTYNCHGMVLIWQLLMWSSRTDNAIAHWHKDKRSFFKKILKDCLTIQLTNPHSKTSKNGHFQYFTKLFQFLNIKYL